MNYNFSYKFKGENKGKLDIRIAKKVANKQKRRKPSKHTKINRSYFFSTQYQLNNNQNNLKYLNELIKFRILALLLNFNALA